MRLQGPCSPGHRDVFSVPAECSSQARSGRSRRSPEILIACSFVLPLRAVGVDALSCPGGHHSSTFHIDTHRGVGVVFTYDSRSRTSPRPHGLWASMRRPVPTGLPSTHGGCEFRSESSMKASTSFTESEDQCLCGQFKGFEYRERLDECSALLLW